MAVLIVTHKWIKWMKSLQFNTFTWPLQEHVLARNRQTYLPEWNPPKNTFGTKKETSTWLMEQQEQINPWGNPSWEVKKAQKAPKQLTADNTHVACLKSIGKMALCYWSCDLRLVTVAGVTGQVSLLFLRRLMWVFQKPFCALLNLEGPSSNFGRLYSIPLCKI